MVKRFAVGFTLLECCVYCALIPLCMLVCMQWSSGVMQAMRTNSLSHEAYIERTLALDLIVRDVQRARLPFCVRNRKNNQYIWPVSDGAVGWVVEGNCLMRIQGAYDFQQEVWGKSQKNLVCRSVDRLEIAAPLTPDPAWVMCALSAAGQGPSLPCARGCRAGSLP